ncbi:uncharacterized protein LOC111036697 [Myzus persicae]|uniref:uncharacterized protein LOC111036697 n=1 Tax=Myzus persicae TaxID=13164 RepID=UPI000B9329BF|nr:uncharacterized protein LOC111036697 [Myzus persicae]
MVIRHEKIGGIGKTVEIDESKFGRRKYHCGHRVEGQWIFGGIERESGLCFLVPVERRDKVTLLSLIKDWILPGTCIISDCWKAYDCLEEGFRHVTVNHSIKFINPDTGAHTNNVEGMWRHAKASLSKYCRKKKFFRGYMAKCMFVKRCRYQKLDVLTEFFKYAGQLYDPILLNDYPNFPTAECSYTTTINNDNSLAQQIKTILSKYQDGEFVLDYYKLKLHFNEAMRNKLVSVIIKDQIRSQVILNRSRFIILAKGIEELFPYETEKTYFILYCKEGNIISPNRGKLYGKFCNIKKEISKISNVKKRHLGVYF